MASFYRLLAQKTASKSIQNSAINIWFSLDVWLTLSFMKSQLGAGFEMTHPKRNINKTKSGETGTGLGSGMGTYLLFFLVYNTKKSKVREGTVTSASHKRLLFLNLRHIRVNQTRWNKKRQRPCLLQMVLCSIGSYEVFFATNSQPYMR